MKRSVFSDARIAARLAFIISARSADPTSRLISAAAWHPKSRQEMIGFVDFAVGELVALLGSNFARRVKLLKLKRWGADPFSRGSYSHALPGKADCRAELAAPVDNRLFFAGEACSRSDYSTAHGAYLSGVAAAEAVIASQKTRR